MQDRTSTDSVAAAKSNVAPEMLRAITRTVLLVQAKAIPDHALVAVQRMNAASPPANGPQIQRMILDSGSSIPFGTGSQATKHFRERC